jgi:hypothetical protein
VLWLVNRLAPEFWVRNNTHFSNSARVYLLLTPRMGLLVAMFTFQVADSSIRDHTLGVAFEPLGKLSFLLLLSLNAIFSNTGCDR